MGYFISARGAIFGQILIALAFTKKTKKRSPKSDCYVDAQALYHVDNVMIKSREVADVNCFKFFVWPTYDTGQNVRQSSKTFRLPCVKE